MKCYRIVTDIYSGYEVQTKKRFLHWVWWVQCNHHGGVNTFSTLEKAKSWIDSGLPKRGAEPEVTNVVWITEGCK